MLGADGKTDGIFKATLICQFLCRQLGMCGRSRMNDQTLDIRYIRQQGEDFQMVNKLPCLFPSSLDIKCKDRTAATGEIFLIEGMVG